MTTPVAVTTKIELSGNLFRRDPGKTLYQNIGDMLDKLADEMEREVRADISAHEGEMRYWTGWTRDHAIGYRTSPRTGKHWAVWVAVGEVTTGMSREQAIRTKAAAATIERRWHPYRRAKDAAYRSRAVISADLTKGLD
jgi:hypothetical protein